jgi:SAM-dependent methyltransferase
MRRSVFLDDVKLVEETLYAFGLMQPMADLGGQVAPVCADYDRLPQSPFVQLVGRPFDHIDPTYTILNPELGDAPIEEMTEAKWGTVICLSVLEHVENPFAVFDGLYRCLLPEGLLILSTVFSFRYHPAPVDYWRFSPECLRMLAEKAGFMVHDAGWRVRALLKQDEEWNLVRGVYVIAQKASE